MFYWMSLSGFVGWLSADIKTSRKSQAGCFTPFPGLKSSSALCWLKPCNTRTDMSLVSLTRRHADGCICQNVATCNELHIYLLHTRTPWRHKTSYLNKGGWEQMAAGTWQHHHRHLLKRDGGQLYMSWVNNSQTKTTWLSVEAEQRISDRGAGWLLTLLPASFDAECHMTDDHISPLTLFKSEACERAACTPSHSSFAPRVLSYVSSMASPLHPLLFPLSHLTPSIYFHLPYILQRPRSPPNRQGCCGWHVSSWELPCRVDGPQYTERRAPQHSPSMCVCGLLFFFFPPVYLSIVRLTAAAMMWLSQYGESLHVGKESIRSFVITEQQKPQTLY